MSHDSFFYVLPENVHNDSFVLTDDEFRHAAKVLRKTVGENINATDGKGHLYKGTITKIENFKLVVKIKSVVNNYSEPRFKLILAQALLKSGNWDLIIEKGTEIGVTAFQPIITEHTIVDKVRMERWHSKALSAMKQCGRTRCPEIFDLLSLDEAFKKYKDIPCYIAHEKAVDCENDFQNNDSAVLFIGPEGGFSENEIKSALDHHVMLTSLGPRRLKSETAAITGIVKILNQVKDI